MSDYSPSSTCYHSNVLSNDVRFETYSDARLAAVFLDNTDQFPVDLFQQVLDVVTDPQFQSSQVTFKNIWGIFDHVSTYRRNMALDRTMPKSHKAERSSGVVPPVILGHVVDTIVQQRTPLGRAAREHWSHAFKRNEPDFDLCNMALVHRSWTEIAQKGLRHRAVIPHRQINRFLINPLCGPWVTEMVIYWTAKEGDQINSNDFGLLGALLAHTPNVRSLAFITGLEYYTKGAEPHLEVGPCPNIILDKLPDLRYFWLGHSNGECSELRSFCTYIPKMHLLEFLYIENWGDWGEGVLNWNEHPPPSLRAIGLHLESGMNEETLAWLLRPRENFNLQSLFIRQGYPTYSYPTLVLSLRSSLHQLEHLSMTMLPIQDVEASVIDDLLLNCNKLTSLDLFYDRGVQGHTVPCLPLSLEQLMIHCTSENIHEMHTTELGFVQSLRDKISMLLQFRSLFVIHHYDRRCLDKAWDYICNGVDSGFYHGLLHICGQADTCLPKELEDFCTGQNIHLACMDAEYM